MPTADPVILTKAGHALLPRIVEGVRYARAGIMVTDLRPTGNQPPLSLFENPHEERHIGTLLEDVTRADTGAAPSAWVTAASGAGPTGP
jgi:DNA polymerase V